MKTIERSAAVLALVACAAACVEQESGNDAGAHDAAEPFHDAGPDASEAGDARVDAETSEDAGAGDAEPDPAPGCVDGSGDGSSRWTTSGGLVLYRDASELYRGLSYRHTRTYSSRAGGPDGGVPEDLSCDHGLSCDLEERSIGGGNLQAAFEHSDVVAAFAREAPVYGYDSRPVDGTLLEVHLLDRVIYVGDDCDGRPGITGTPCVEVPPGVKALRDLLLAFDAQELALDECARIFGS